GSRPAAGSRPAIRGNNRAVARRAGRSRPQWAEPTARWFAAWWFAALRRLAGPGRLGELGLRTGPDPAVRPLLGAIRPQLPVRLGSRARLPVWPERAWLLTEVRHPPGHRQRAGQGRHRQCPYDRWHRGRAAGAARDTPARRRDRRLGPHLGRSPRLTVSRSVP